MGYVCNKLQDEDLVMYATNYKINIGLCTQQTTPNIEGRPLIVDMLLPKNFKLVKCLRIAESMNRKQDVWPPSSGI